MSRRNTEISYSELCELGYIVTEEASSKSFNVWSDGEVDTYRMIGYNIHLTAEDMFYLNQVWGLDFFDI